MSWSIDVTGTKEAVKARVNEHLDQIAKGYGNKPEAADIAMCKERALALIDACRVEAMANGVTVKANGSHYSLSETEIGSANFQLNVSRVSLAL